MVKTLMVAMVLLSACKKSAQPDCDGAGKAIEASVAEIAANGKDELARETARRVGPAAGANVVLRCKQDSWSAATTDCVKAITGSSRFSECESKMTKDQVDKLKASVPVIEGTMPPGSNTAAAPSGPPPDCAGVEAAMTKFWNERVAIAKDDTERKFAENMRVVARQRIGKHCSEDRWSAEAADCFKQVTNGDFASCESKLTPMQVSSVRASAPAIDPTPALGSAAAAAGVGSAEAAEAGSAE
jgi:hypothetical protein